MSFSENEIRETISEARKSAKERKERNFTESMEILVSLRDIDLKDPTQRFNVEAKVPHPVNEDPTTVVFAEGDMGIRAQDLGLTVYGRKETEDLGKNPKEARRVARQTDFLICMAPLMPIVGRYWGKILGPRGKMPKPVPPNAELKPLIDDFTRTVRLRVKTNPSVNAKIGDLDNSDEELAENGQVVIQTVIRNLERGRLQLKQVMFKTTMGPSVEL